MKPLHHLVNGLAPALIATTAYAQDLAEIGPVRVTDVELRERFQLVNNPGFDPDADASGWLWTQRAAVAFEAEFSPRWSARINLQSAVMSGGPDSPINANELDLREAQLVYAQGETSVTLGRQDIIIGSQRLLGTRDGTNVRRQWDGVRVRTQAGDWALDAFAAALVDVEPEGAFNDTPDDDRLIAGINATTRLPAGSADLYYLRADTADLATIEGVADQTRHSVGARLFGEHGRVFWNWEAIYQFGEHGDLDISAWTLATNTGYRFDAVWSPEIMLSANISSGDDENGDGELNTFDALYPRGNYFSSVALLGPSNFYNINPYVRFSPTPKLDVSVDINWYWRTETNDGVYTPSGRIFRAPSASTSARFVNTAVSAQATYAINDAVSLEAIYTHSEPQTFIADTGPAEPIDFLELTLRVRF